MTPTREQFKDFIASIKKAQEKEDNLDKAFELIWDDDQGQYTPFYISPLWGTIYMAFIIMFGLESDEYGESELSWWLERRPRTKPFTISMRMITTSLISMLFTIIW